MTVINHKLFSHTYLAQLQADSSNDEAAAPIAQGLRDWLPFRDGSSLQTLVDSWLGPVLDFLEFHHTPADGGLHIHHLYPQAGDDKPIGLCYVVPLGEDLNDTTKGCHPMARAVMALRACDLRWGILTNGDQWRLLDAQALRRYEFYLEIDLDQLAAGDDLSPGRLLHACFHRTAFMPDGEGKPRLDHLLEASAKATKAAEDHLKAAVSHNEGIMAQLCLGLVRASGRARHTEAERDAIYRDATYLLYRILFILYAEAEGLLPVDNPAYRAASLTELIKTAHQYKLHGMPDPQGTTLWQRFKRLCSAIYESDPALDIPAYNGGLFDDGDKPYLGDSVIADAYLIPALFDLVYRSNSDSYQPIDYRDLSVRHLGSIYEGMIEYKLQIAEEPLWARRDKKGTVRFLKTGQEGAPRKNDMEIKAGDVYFSQSPGERRATGTYYTPEHIVDYIVSQTVWRGLAERRAPLEEKLAGWLEEIAAVTDPAEQARMQRTADGELQRFVEEQVLTFRVCDPAMGSGHFLVNAAHQIANFIVETLSLTPWENVEVDVAPAVWRRWAVECCLYGVDLSLMAVELAKLSLWLASVAQGKPLSFLDHHLRRGNSLIGARLEDLADTGAATPPPKERKAREAGQLSMLDDPAFSQHLTAATDLLEQISRRVAETVQDVKAQESDYERVRAELEPYRRFADLWTAYHLGLDVEKRKLHSIFKYLVNGATGPAPGYERLLAQTQKLADEWTIFHWEIEFPIPMLLGGGFDVVVGNPPYDELSEVALGRDIDEKDFFLGTELYAKSATGRLNLYRLFIARAMASTIGEGRHSFIVPMSLLGDRFTLELRSELLTKTCIVLIEAFPQKDDPDNRVFCDAKLPTCIYVVAKRRPQGSFRVRIHPGKDILSDSPSCSATVEQIISFDPENLCIPLASQSHWDLAQKIANSEHLVPIREVATPTSGEIVFNQAFGPYLTDDPKHALVLRGGHVQRYKLLDDPKQGTPVYLNLEKYLANARPGSKAFDHSNPRIVYQEGAALDNWRRIIATYLPAGEICGHKICYFVNVQYDELAFLALFNSSIPEWHFRLISTTNSLAAYQIAGILIPDIEFTTPLADRKRSTAEAIGLHLSAVSSGDFRNVIAFVDQRVCPATTRQSDVVHDLLGYLAQQMIDLNKERQRLDGKVDLFRFLSRETSCSRLDEALGGRLVAGEMIREQQDPPAVHHDIEGLRLCRDRDGCWMLEVRAKLRAPFTDWREYQRDPTGNFIRSWLPVYRLSLDEATGRFYQYAFSNLKGFDGAGKFPGGRTRTTLEKLHATKIPEFVSVDLAPLVEAEAELAEVRSKIELTDDLIDQIVYRLYGLTEEEIAVVEGRSAGYKMQMTEYTGDLWHNREPHPALAELLSRKDCLIEIVHGEPPYQVVIGVPHQAPVGVCQIAEEWCNPGSKQCGRDSDEAAALFALVAFTGLRDRNIPCKLVIAAHATDHDPNKELESPYCQRIFAHPARLLFECHGAGRKRSNDLELSSGSNSLTDPAHFGHLLNQALGGRYRVAAQAEPGAKAAVLLGDEHTKKQRDLSLPALSTNSLRQAEAKQMHALHVEAKPRFRKSDNEPNTLTQDGDVLGQSIASAIAGYLDII